MRHQAAPSFFQRGYCFFTRNAWILLQEVVDSLATFKIVGQGFERNPGATKHRFATENGRVLYDNVVRFQRCRLATTLILTAGKGVSKPQCTACTGSAAQIRRNCISDRTPSSLFEGDRAAPLALGICYRPRLPTAMPWATGWSRLTAVRAWNRTISFTLARERRNTVLEPRLSLDTPTFEPL